MNLFQPRYIKRHVVTLTYLYLLYEFFINEINSIFIFLFSYILEFALLAIIILITSSLKRKPRISILLISVFLLSLCYPLAAGVSKQMNDISPFYYAGKENLLVPIMYYKRIIIIMASSILFGYLFDLFFLLIEKKDTSIFSYNIFKQGILLWGMSLFLFLTMWFFTKETVFYLVILLSIVRISFEWYIFGKYEKKVLKRESIKTIF